MKAPKGMGINCLVLSLGRPAQASGQPLCSVGGEEHKGGWLDRAQARQSHEFFGAEFIPDVFSEFDFRLRLEEVH